VSLTKTLLLTVLAGYYLRFHAPLPAWLRDATGGAAYVVFFALLAGLRLSSRRASIAAFVFTCAIEFLQLWRPPALEFCRGTLPGRLVLGTTFSWSDFPPYGAGALLAWAMLARIQRRLN